MEAHRSMKPFALAVSAVGMIAGAILGSSIPIPFAGNIIGAGLGLVVRNLAGQAGAYVAGAAFDYIFPRKRETPVEVVSQMHSLQQSGQEVTPEGVFVALTGSLRHQDK